MNLGDKGKNAAAEAENAMRSDVSDGELDEALKDFKLSVDAWSEAAYSRPRTVAQTVRRRSWRLAAGWALGCTLAVTGISGVAYERHEREVQAKAFAAHQAGIREQQRQAAAAGASQVDDEDLLAKVDKDISQQVPSAMEPLAQMAEEDSK